MSDEIHYINDVDRGSVWEETLMHLPSSVQMVALSATLRAPEAFLGWIGCVPHPPGLRGLTTAVAWPSPLALPVRSP